MMNTASLKPDSVSIVNITPAAPTSERTMRCTPADSATSACVKPLCTRYEIARSLYSDANTCFMRSSTSSMPTTFRYDSCWPANDASGRSSAVADERTANDSSAGEPLFRISNCARISCSRRACSGASTIHLRISAPASASAFTSSMSSDSRRLAMRSVRSLCLRKSRNASAVVAKPVGTRTPASESWLIISPSDAFLPPTISTSVIRNCSNGITYAWSFATFAALVIQAPKCEKKCSIAQVGSNAGACKKARRVLRNLLEKQSQRWKSSDPRCAKTRQKGDVCR